MQVHVDLERCTGTANCVVAAPQVFDIADDADQVRVLVAEVPTDLRAAVGNAVRMCPQGALTMTD